MKKGMVGAIAGVSALLMVLTGCEDLVTSNVDARQDGCGSTHYYVDLVPAAGIPVVEDLNNGNKDDTSYALAEAFNKYDAVYYVGDRSVAVPPGKTLYIAPGSAVPSFHVAAEVSRGGAARAGVSMDAGAAKLVVLDGATMPLDGYSTLGGLLQVNVGGRIDKGAGNAAITGAGRVVVGGRIDVDNITVAGDVYVAQGDGDQHGVITADIDTTWLALKTRTPNEKGCIDHSAADSSGEDFYAFESVAPETSRDVRVDGAVRGSITSGGDVYIAENSHVTGLNAFYGYVNGSITTYGKAEVLGNVTGNVIAKGAVAVGSNLSPNPHRAQVGGAIYSRTGNVIIKPRANSGDIVAYRGNVTIEEGAVATGIDTYYDNSPYNNSQYDGVADLVNHGNVMVKGIVSSSINSSGASGAGSGGISSGGTVAVRRYGDPNAAWKDFGPNGYVSGDVAARYSATIDGVVGGDLDTASYSFDNESETQNVMVNGVVGGRVLAGGTLTVADHHNVPGNVNPSVSFGAIYANGYVGGGAAVQSRNGTGPSVISGYVTGGSFSVGAPATVAIASTGRVNTFGHGSSGYHGSAQVYGTLAIDSGGELDADSIGDIHIGGSDNSDSLTDGHVLAHANSLANGGRLGPSWSGIAIAPGARLYTATPIAIPDSGSPADQEAQFMALAASQVIHTNVASAIGSLGVYSGGPLALTVGLCNSVTLTANTNITGTVTVDGLLALNGHKLTLSGSGVIALGADNSPVFNYDTDYSNGAISFANSSSALEFNSATAALDGLSSLPDEEANYDSSGNRYNAGPVVIGVQNPASYHNIVAEFTTPPGTVAGGPAGGSFMPGIGAALQGAIYSSGTDYISKTSGFVWTYSAYAP
jgi:cytoskeletal protein CcmA (bactofilin family)